jgi:hypothetical protein
VRNLNKNTRQVSSSPYAEHNWPRARFFAVFGGIEIRSGPPQFGAVNQAVSVFRADAYVSLSL